MTGPALPVRIVEHLTGKAKRPLTLQEIARELDLGDGDHADLRGVLSTLEDEGQIYKIKHQRYALPGQIGLVVGRLDATRGGAGFVVPDQKGDDPDIFVAQNKLASAAHRDRVVARIERSRRDGSPEGRIIRILERARSRVVGKLQRGKHFGFVVPDNPRLHFDVYVAQEDLQHAEEGQKVVVEIDDWGDGTKNPEGRVTDVLGFPDQPGVDIASIVVAHGLEREFPAEAEAAAEQLTADIQTEVKRRLDFRDRVSFTIDPADAEDFDDALSLRQMDGGLFEIGIHIADVSHFVASGGPVDEEAYERATSAYLVDRTVPMLPERLSNNLCSLVPEEDRLTFSVILTMDGEGDVKDYSIRETVIRSRFRLTYPEAQGLIQGTPQAPEQKSIVQEIQIFWRLAKLLRAKRFERGSLDFDLPEAIVELDAEGFPVDIKESVRLESMRLIEEFMLLANETVARHALRRKIPFLYRVHDVPSPEKLDRIRQFVGALGYHLPKPRKGPDPQQFAEILRQAKGKREEELINTVILRSMMQARYQVENIGHFGLASDHYTHFTSPIRRYPDLIVHRLVKQLEAGERWKDSDARDRQVAWLVGAAEHCSLKERNATEAERDSIDLKKVEFMQRHIGAEFDGKISGVTAFGFFVRLDEYFVEGLVHVNELEDDYYEFREDQYALLGRNTGRRFRLADPVRVRVGGVNKEARQIDFALVGKEKEKR